MRLNKKQILFIIILVVFVLFFVFGKNQLKTIGVSINILFLENGWRPLTIFTAEPTKEEFFIESPSGRDLTIHIYSPKKGGDSAMVIYTPFINKGLDDPRLINLADTFARAGFVVAVPWRYEEQKIISTKDIDDVVATSLFVKEKFNTEKVGLFGISYGNGPTIIASTHPQIKDFISFIISFSGYYNIESALNFIITKEADPYSKEILAKTLEYYKTDQKTFLKETEFKELKNQLSPSSFKNEISADMFIAHSANDKYIPYTESLQMKDELSKYMPITFAFSSFFEHGAY